MTRSSAFVLPFILLTVAGSSDIYELPTAVSFRDFRSKVVWFDGFQDSVVACAGFQSWSSDCIFRVYGDNDAYFELCVTSAASLVVTNISSSIRIAANVAESTARNLYTRVCVALDVLSVSLFVNDESPQQISWATSTPFHPQRYLLGRFHGVLSHFSCFELNSTSAISTWLLTHRTPRVPPTYGLAQLTLSLAFLLLGLLTGMCIVFYHRRISSSWRSPGNLLLVLRVALSYMNLGTDIAVVCFAEFIGVVTFGAATAFLVVPTFVPLAIALQSFKSRVYGFVRTDVDGNVNTLSSAAYAVVGSLRFALAAVLFVVTWTFRLVFFRQFVVAVSLLGGVDYCQALAELGIIDLTDMDAVNRPSLKKAQKLYSVTDSLLHAAPMLVIQCVNCVLLRYWAPFSAFSVAVSALTLLVTAASLLRETLLVWREHRESNARELSYMLNPAMQKVPGL